MLFWTVVSLFFQNIGKDIRFDISQDQILFSKNCTTTFNVLARRRSYNRNAYGDSRSSQDILPFSDQVAKSAKMAAALDEFLHDGQRRRPFQTLPVRRREKTSLLHRLYPPRNTYAKSYRIVRRVFLFLSKGGKIPPA